jgi:transmembrane sensor
MDENKKWDLIIRSLSGEASYDEQASINEWLLANSSNQEFYEDSHQLLPDYEKEEVYQIIQNRIKESEANLVQTSSQISYHTPERKFGWLKIAASWAFIAVTGLSAYWFVTRTKLTDQPNWVTITNEAGKRSKVFLPDSSVVWLNTNSSLGYPMQFTSDHRDVVLRGEAFFEVTEDAKSPFTVITGNIHTTVLGTSFNINSENEANDISISVLTGKVKVLRVNENKKEQQLGQLNPNEQLSYTESNNSYQIKTLANAYDYASWKDGTLRFRNMNFEQIAQKLEHWYGMKIIFKDDAIRKCQLEGTFYDVPIEKVMKMLSITARFEYVIQGDSITVSGKGCY